MHSTLYPQRPPTRPPPQHKENYINISTLEPAEKQRLYHWMKTNKPELIAWLTDKKTQSIKNTFNGSQLLLKESDLQGFYSEEK